MGINWLVRIKNKAWWLAIIPAVCLLVQAVFNAFGITWDYTDMVGKFAAIVEAVFGVLVLLGITIDPTTSGIGDSYRALGYTTPAANAAEVNHFYETTEETNPHCEN